MNLAPADRIGRSWSRLSMLWALYYLVIFTLGQIPQFEQKTIWLGAALVGLFSAPIFLRHVRGRHVPREGILLALFLLWSLTGLVVASDLALFTRYFKLVGMLALIVIFVSLILRNSGEAKWFYLAFLGVAVFRVVFWEEPISMEQITQTKGVIARLQKANAIGFYCDMGILGLLALFAETKRIWLRAALIGAGVLALYGVVLSASRGAFAALIAIVLLWPGLCLVGGFRFKLKTVVAAAILLWLAYGAYQFIVKETYMGVRFTKSTHMEDNSTQVRYDLVRTGFRIFAQNPLVGCGLGQFGIASGTGYYAHNELAEIAATTGLPGLILYYSVYVIAWRRLTRSLRCFQDSLMRYRINMARLLLLILVVSGSLSRPNFLGQDTMFLLGVAVGMAHWAERMARSGAGFPWRKPVPMPPRGFAVSSPSAGFPGFGPYPDASFKGNGSSVV